MSSSNDEYEENRTPSPGLTYNSLLNDSSDEGYLKLTKYSHIETEKQDQSKLQILRSENQLLRAQIELIQKEKEMHIRSNAQEKLKFDKNISYLQNTLESELVKLKRENEALANQNKLLLKKMQKKESFKGEKANFYKMQMERMDRHYSILINDKDRMIAMLKNELNKKKTKKAASKHGSHRGSVLSQDFTTPKVSYSSFFPSSNQNLENISQLIVKLEKEQAVLKEAVDDANDSNETEFNFQSLKDLGERNKERFSQLQTQHRTYAKNRLSSQF